MNLTINLTYHPAYGYEVPKFHLLEIDRTRTLTPRALSDVYRFRENVWWTEGPHLWLRERAWAGQSAAADGFIQGDALQAVSAGDEDDLLVL